MNDGDVETRSGQISSRIYDCETSRKLNKQMRFSKQMIVLVLLAGSSFLLQSHFTINHRQLERPFTETVADDVGEIDWLTVRSVKLEWLARSVGRVSSPQSTTAGRCWSLSAGL